MISRFTYRFLGFLLAIVCASIAHAEERQIDPAGVWVWTLTTANGDSREAILRLKVDGEKLTGSLMGRTAENRIEEGKIEGDRISFQVTRERDGLKFVSNYSGKIEGETIKGKMDFLRDGEIRTTDWQAKRRSTGRGGGKGFGLTGNWKYLFSTPNGNSSDHTIKLKQEGEKITGTVEANGNQSPIADVVLAEKVLTFKVERERDGKIFATVYKGKVEGDTYKGQMTSNRDGTERIYDFEAKR